MGLAHVRLGNSREAAKAYDEALEWRDRHRISESAAYGSNGLAAMAVETGRVGEAAILLGAADEQLAAAGAVLELTERPLHDHTLEQTGANSATSSSESH